MEKKMNLAFADSRSFKGEGVQKEKPNLVEFPVSACGIAFVKGLGVQ